MKKYEFTKCWDCKNSVCAGCSWAREFKPVEGWEAKKTFIPSNGEYAESYHVINCPKFIKG